MKKYIYILFVITCFFACKANDPDIDDLVITSEKQIAKIIEADKGRLYTLNEFQDQFMTEEGNWLSDEHQYRTRAKYTKNGRTYYLFSIDTLPTAGKGIYIRGRVTTDDYGGNFYKSLCIQQIVNGQQQSLRISVDAGSISGMYPLGQEILIRCNGLAIGRYANQPQLCVPSYNNNQLATNATQKVGWAPGRISLPAFKRAVTYIGIPDKSKLQYDEMSITEYTNLLTVGGEERKLDGSLVRIKNVHYTGQYSNNGSPANCTTGDPETDVNSNVFAPTTTNIGYPQGRIVVDANGNKTVVSNSEYAKFARFYLPPSNYSGDIEGILGFYVDNGTSTTRYGLAWDDWSITIRNLDDLHLTDTQGNPWPRIEYSNK